MMFNISQKEQEEEQKIQKKARRWAYLWLLLMIILILWPFINESKEEKRKYDQVVHVEFEDKKFEKIDEKKAGAAKSSAKPAEAKKEESTEAEQPDPVEKAEPIAEAKPEPTPERKPQTIEKVPTPIVSAKREPVLTTRERSAVKMSDLLKDVSKNAQVEEVSDQVTEVIEELPKDSEAKMKKRFRKAKKSKKTKPGGSNPGNDSSAGAKDSGDGKSDTAGEGDSGSSDSGDAKTDGKADEGDSGDDFSGDGLLTRKVIYRASLNEIMKETGKIVINLCVNRDGAVVFSEVDEERTTIKNPLLMKKAEMIIAKYRFEKDYTVAEKQCGSYSYLLKIEN